MFKRHFSFNLSGFYIIAKIKDVVKLREHLPLVFVVDKYGGKHHKVMWNKIKLDNVDDEICQLVKDHNINFVVFDKFYRVCIYI